MFISSSAHNPLTPPSWCEQAKTTAAPLERVKILFQVATMHYPFTGVANTLRSIVRREGFTGLYRGNVSSLVRIFPYAAIQFAAFDTLKAMLTPSGAGVSPLGNFFAGAGAGATAVVFTYPLDVTRARLAVQVRSHGKRSVSERRKGEKGAAEGALAHSARVGHSAGREEALLGTLARYAKHVATRGWPESDL